MKIKMPMDIGGNKVMVESDGDKLTMTMQLDDKRELTIEIDDSKKVMGKIQELTGRAAWELKAVVEELMRRAMANAVDNGIEKIAITVATVEALLRKIFPESMPAETKQ